MSSLPALIVPGSNVNTAHNAQKFSVINNKASEPKQLINTENANSFQWYFEYFWKFRDGSHESIENLSFDQYTLYLSESSDDD